MNLYSWSITETGTSAGIARRWGCMVRWEDEWMRLYDPVSESYLRTHEEDAARADDVVARADYAAARADAESAARAEVDALIRQLQDQLARQRVVVGRADGARIRAIGAPISPYNPLAPRNENIQPKVIVPSLVGEFRIGIGWPALSV